MEQGDCICVQRTKEAGEEKNKRDHLSLSPKTRHPCLLEHIFSLAFELLAFASDQCCDSLQAALSHAKSHTLLLKEYCHSTTPAPREDERVGDNSAAGQKHTTLSAARYLRESAVVCRTISERC